MHGAADQLRLDSRSRTIAAEVLMNTAGHQLLDCSYVVAAVQQMCREKK